MASRVLPFRELTRQEKKAAQAAAMIVKGDDPGMAKKDGVIMDRDLVRLSALY